MSCCGLEFQFLSVPTHSRLPSRSTRTTFYVSNPPLPLGYNTWLQCLKIQHMVTMFESIWHLTTDTIHREQTYKLISTTHSFPLYPFWRAEKKSLVSLAMYVYFHIWNFPHVGALFILNLQFNLEARKFFFLKESLQ